MHACIYKSGGDYRDMPPSLNAVTRRKNVHTCSSPVSPGLPLSLSFLKKNIYIVYRAARDRLLILPNYLRKRESSPFASRFSPFSLSSHVFRFSHTYIYTQAKYIYIRERESLRVTALAPLRLISRAFSLSLVLLYIYAMRFRLSPLKSHFFGYELTIAACAALHPHSRCIYLYIRADNSS